MKIPWRIPWSARLLPLQTLLIPALALAQLISVKSVPVATAEQFLLVPSQNLGMGGVSIAVADPSLDPFVNPAKGARIRGGYLFSAPVFSSITQHNGGLRTLPLGMLLGTVQWFGGATLAMQQYRQPETSEFMGWVSPLDLARNSSQLLSDQNANNVFATSFVGAKLPGSNIALGVGASWAGLEARSGVDLLYANSFQIKQHGHVADFRAGFLYDSPDHPTLELLVLHQRIHMTHEVSYRNWFWEGDFFPANFTNEVQNLDQTDTWGVHTGSTIPLGAGTRAGIILTANKKSHPKIPNYDLMNIPRDPGDTWAFNFGTGIAHDQVSNILALDLIYEPIWSHTWAEAATGVVTNTGGPIAAGSKTVENYFRFNNFIARVGLSEQDKVFGFQLGLQVRMINYHLKQDDFVAGTRRTQKEVWGEWTPTLGLNLNLSSFQIRYSGTLTTGTGQPGVAPSFAWRTAEAVDLNFLIAPSGRLTLQEAVVLTHQISVVFALPSSKP